MKKFLRFIAMLLVSISLFSCGGGGNPSNGTNTGEVPNPKPDPKPAPEVPWNKDRTFEVMVLSNASATNLAQSEKEYTSLADKIKSLPKDSYSMIIAEQCNMINATNPALSFPLPLNQFAYFNLHDYSNESAQSSMVLSKTWIAETNQQLLAGTSYLLQMDLKLVGTSQKKLTFPIHFASFRIDSDGEVSGFTELQSKLTNARKPHLFFGSVANGLLDSFKKSCAGVADYELTVVEQVKIKGFSYIFFAPKSFKLREAKEVLALGGVKGVNLAIETGVGN